jgi:hypothetical protein
MQWMTGEGWTLAYGSGHGYLVTLSEIEVRLTRFSISESGLAAKLALGVTRTTIVFPLGRGPGRPGGAPELAALAESAKGYAERYEAGESLEGYPAWQHAAVPGQQAAPPAAREPGLGAVAAPEPPRVTGPGHSRLTRLADQMLDVMRACGQGRVRAVVMLDDPDDHGDDSGGIAISGYAPDEVPAELLANVAEHVGALGQTYGVPLALLIGVPPSEPSE